jgi:hypothetical protein
MDKTLLGCNRCGWVARPEMFDGAPPACLECGGGLRELGVDYARRLVAAQRRADQRRDAVRKSAEVWARGGGPIDPAA